MLYDQAKTEVYEDIFRRIREIESRMSVFLPDSDISRVNAAAGIEPVQVHDDVFKVIERALHFAEISGGAFDPTVGPLVSLWGIAGNNPRVPSQDEISAVLPLVNWRDIEMDRERRSVFLKRPGMALDLGAIAKGYVADEAAAIVRDAGLERALIDLGGNIITYGMKQDRTPWRVGLQNPLGDRGDYVGFVSGWEQTVVTSGIYERYFMEDGVHYHHLFSPFSGYPAHNNLLSVTVVAVISMDADALSTAAFVMGYEKGRTLIDSLDGVEAIFLFEDMSVRKTGGVSFVLTDVNYRVFIE
jgi:thiamine biosynthesis lipoprotein